MASVKIFSLAVKTLAKPISNSIKQQAQQHERFRNICIGLAQVMHRTEARMRMGLLNEEAKNIKPLNDTRAVQNGATTLAESFLFLVGAGLVLGETYRSSRKEGKRRDDVRDRLEGLESELLRLKSIEEGRPWEGEIEDLRQRNEFLEKALTTVVDNGLRAGWLSLGHSDGLGEIIPLLNGRRLEGTRRGDTGQADSEGIAGTGNSGDAPLTMSGVVES